MRANELRERGRTVITLEFSPQSPTARACGRQPLARGPGGRGAPWRGTDQGGGARHADGRHPDDVLELAMLLGIRYTRDQRGGFMHANVITVLNQAGEIVHRHEGLQQDMASTLEAIRRAVQP